MTPRAARPIRTDTWSRARRSAGFTLLELLLSLSIAGLVAVTLLSALSVAFGSRRGAREAAEPARRAALAVQVLREDLESALPPRGPLAAAFFSVDADDLNGLDSDEVTFSAATPGPLHVSGTGDVKRVVYAVLTLTGTGQRVLVRRVYGNLLSPFVLDPDDEILCRDVGSFNLRFFDGTVWWDSWDAAFEGNEVPAAVEVTLELQPSDDASRDGGAPGGPATPAAPWPRFVRVIQLSCAGQGEPDDESAPASPTDGASDPADQGRPSGPGSAPGGMGPGGMGPQGRGAGRPGAGRQ